MESFLRQAVFLDRDGTINVDKDYLYRWEDFEYINGAVEGMEKLCRLGYILVVITNQSGIARGYYSEEDFHTLNERMVNDLRNRGVMISGVYYCPHYKRGMVAKYAIECCCRKPGTQLFWKAKQELGINMEKSFCIGDKLRDLAICDESEVKGILLGGTESQNVKDEIMICENLRMAADYIERQR